MASWPEPGRTGINGRKEAKTLATTTQQALELHLEVRRFERQHGDGSGDKTLPRFAALEVLQEGPMTACALAARLGIENRGVTHLIRGLQQRGLARITVPESDRRVHLVEALQPVPQGAEGALDLYLRVKRFRELGCSLVQSAAVEILRWHGSMSAGILAARLGLACSATTALIDRMEQRGIARRVGHPDGNRRIVIIALVE